MSRDQQAAIRPGSRRHREIEAARPLSVATKVQDDAQTAIQHAEQIEAAIGTIVSNVHRLQELGAKLRSMRMEAEPPLFLLERERLMEGVLNEIRYGVQGNRPRNAKTYGQHFREWRRHFNLPESVIPANK